VSCYPEVIAHILASSAKIPYCDLFKALVIMMNRACKRQAAQVCFIKLAP
jgi:hypothetical protein